MFTGIIEEVGTVEAAGAQMRIAARLVTSDLHIGDSVNVSGVCLTAVEVSAGGFVADASPETLGRSTLGELSRGDAVNLERAMAPTSRFGGHIVQGHIDGAGRIVSLEQLGDNNWWVRVEVPPELERYVVFKGSIAIDGMSLTLADVDACVVAVTVIPHTYQNTTLHRRRPGDRVNIETDVLAKYVEKMVRALDVPKPLTVERLKEMGY